MVRTGDLADAESSFQFTARRYSRAGNVWASITSTINQGPRGGTMSRIFSAAAAVVLYTASAQAQAPQGYPADYAKLIEAANKEGRVVVYSTTDAAAANP